MLPVSGAWQLNAAGAIGLRPISSHRGAYSRLLSPLALRRPTTTWGRTMKTATELSLFLENKPGALAAILADFKKHRLNLEAITIVDHTDHALVRMIVSDKKRALHVLEGAGLL